MDMHSFNTSNCSYYDGAAKLTFATRPVPEDQRQLAARYSAAVAVFFGSIHFTVSAAFLPAMKA